MKALQGAEVHEVQMTTRYLVVFMIVAIVLEILDLIFRAYTGVKSWDILRQVIYGKDFVNIFILQYTIGNLLPFTLLLLPRLTLRRTALATILVLFAGFMHYQSPHHPPRP